MRARNVWLDRRNIWTAIRALLLLGVTTFALERAWGQSTVFTFDPDVPIDQQQLVRDAITLGDQFFQTRLGTTVQGTTNVFVFADPERLADAYLAFFNLSSAARSGIVERFKDCGCGEANFGVIFQSAAGDGWNIATAPAGAGLRNHRIKRILHEYNHVFQFDLAGPQPGCCPSDQVPAIGPVWMVEGTAEYLTWVFFGDSGVIDFDAVIQSQRNGSRSVGALRNFETYDGLFAEPSSQALAEVAADVLAALNGFPALASFWRGIGTGATWQKAFESAFGRTIEKFYVEFEEIRNRDFDDLDLDGMSDEFEIRFGLNPYDPDDATLDGDADGVTNLGEFRAGTNPNVNEAAVLQTINTILVD